MIVQSMPYPASAAYPAAVWSWDFVTVAGIGTTDYTTSMGGATPTGVIQFGTASRASDGTEGAEGYLSIGSYDGTTQYCIQPGIEDANRYARNESQGSLRYLKKPNQAGALENATGSFITNGVRLNMTAVNGGTPPPRTGTFMAFSGQSYQGSVSLGASATDVTAPGFQPDVVFIYGIAGQTSGTNMRYSVGIATSDGTQRAIFGSSAWQPASLATYQTLATDACAGAIDESTGSLIYKVSIGSFDSSGFTLTPSASASGHTLYYLALKLDTPVKILDITTPTSTGNASITGTGFAVQHVLAFMTNLEAVDSYPGSTSDLQGCLSINALSASGASGQAIRWDNGTSNSKSQFKAALLSPSATNTSAGQATVTSMDSGGVTLNWSSVQGTAKKGFGLFLAS